MNIVMKALDAGFFFAEKPGAPAHFGPLLIMSPPSDARRGFVKALVEGWRQCNTFASPFNYRLNLLPVPSWTVLPDEEIDLDYHLRHVALPKPGNAGQLNALLSRLHSNPLDRKRPLWECYIIEGLKGGRFALFMKLHHGQLDGMGSVRLMQRFLSTDPSTTDAAPPWAVGMRSNEPSQDKEPKNKPDGGIRKIADALPEASLALAKLYLDAYLGGAESPAAPFQAPSSILNGRIGSARQYSTQHYTLARLKNAAKLAGATVNDVFLCMCGSALRRYLMDLNELPRKSLVAQVPVSVRPADDASVGNALTFIFVSLGTDIADPIERLDAVHASSKAAKKTYAKLSSGAIEPYTMLQQAPWISQVVSNLSGRLPPVSNLVISNVLGPPERVYFNGATVEHIYGPSVLFHGQALNITMSSYAGDLDASFTGCRTSLPNMQNLASYTEDALQELELVLQTLAKREE